MKKILLILLSCFCMGTCVFGEENAGQTDTAVESSAHQSEKKEAEKWLKKHMAKSKKAYTALKKIKDPKSCKRAAKSIKKLGYKLNGSNDINNEVKRLDTPAMRQVIKKHKKTLERQNDQLTKELSRVEELVVEYEELNDTYDSMGINETVTVISLLTSKLIHKSEEDDEEENAHFGE